MKHRVIVIEPDQNLGLLLRYIVEGLRDFELVRSYSLAEDALLSIRLDEPDVVYLGSSNDDPTALNFVPQFFRKNSELRFLLSSKFDQHDYLQEAMGSGVCGFLQRNSGVIEIEDAIKAIVSERAYFSASVASKYIEYYQKKIPSPLTRREIEIINSLAMGNTYRMIAQELRITIATVKVHLANIYNKLRASNKAEAISKAKEFKLIRLTA